MKIKLSVLLTGIVLAVGVFIVFLVNLTQLRITSTYTSNQPLIQVSDNLKYKTTLAHLWFEEYMAGDQSINPEKDVITNFISSKKILTGITQGAETELGTFEKIEDPDMKALVRSTLEELNQIENYTRQRWNNKIDQDKTASGDSLKIYANVGEEAGGELDQKFDASFEKIQSLLDEFKRLVNQKVVNDVASVHTLSIIVSCLLILIFIAMAFVFFKFQHKNELFTQSQASRMEAEKIKLEQMTIFADQIGQGNYEHTLRIEDQQSDSLAKALVNMKDKLKNVAEEDKKRNWANMGMAKMGEIIRSNNDNAEQFYFNIIAFIVKYLDANQGGLFVINNQQENETFIELKACIAFERKKFIHKRIEIGEGLVGRCMQEGASIYMTQLPDNYITITSGLGKSNPNSLLLVPLKVNEEVFGIIEIASFQHLQTYEIDFIEKIAESIGAAISEVKVNENTKLLLSKAQLQAEELRAQEEEMRQNMEELAATQEEMRRKEHEYIQMIEKLKEEKSNVN